MWSFRNQVINEISVWEDKRKWSKLWLYHITYVDKSLDQHYPTALSEMMEIF